MAIDGSIKTLDADLRGRYLARLELDPQPPSVDALFRLHRAHVECVPWETLWIQMGERWGIDPVESARRISDEGRGGYCFHLNGAFGLLLEALGYQVTRHVGGVHGPDGPSEEELTNHLVLTVSGLADETNPGGTWYLDAGLGDALHEPLPLAAGTYTQGPHTYAIVASPGSIGDWRFVHHPGGSSAGMAWLAAPATMDAFIERHTTLSTSPDSGFVRLLSVQRRDAGGVDVLRGLTLVRSGHEDRSDRLETRDELFGALREVFGLDLSRRRDDEVDALWDRVHAADVAWRQSQET